MSIGICKPLVIMQAAAVKEAPLSTIILSLIIAVSSQTLLPVLQVSILQVVVRSGTETLLYMDTRVHLRG